MTDQAQKYVDSLDLEYKAEFVPQSRSRNKDDKNPSLNWRVTVGSITTDYMQGIGHLPGYKPQMRTTVYEDEKQRKAAETGAIFRGNSFYIGKKIPAPKLIDVLHSLVMDSIVIDSATYEDWAADFGYDTDSRAGEKIYNQCLEIALRLRQFIDLDAAQEAFQDY